jgi:L-fuconolactonase
MHDIPVTDTHLHLWDPAKFNYPWLDDVPPLKRAFLLSDYNDATEGIGVERMVFLQCDTAADQSVDEARWVAEIAQSDPRIRAIVAAAPLEKGDAARDVLDALSAVPNVRGVRRLIQAEDDPFCIEPDFVRGVQMLADYDMSFDICIKGDGQFANVLELVRQCPNVRFILDHIGKPYIADATTEPWSGYITQLAAMPNTWCKISGVVTEANPENWTIDDIEPYISHCLEAFGFDRCAYGGDWPVVTLAGTYSRWFETLSKLTSACSEGERRSLFRNTASEFYQLEA